MLKIKINGIVQGVGFRPFVYRIAREWDLKGYVLNSSAGVEIAACGQEKDLQNFLTAIKVEKPAAAQINSLSVEKLPDEKFCEFSIKKSGVNEGFTQISPDLATCKDCLQELFSPEDPRYKYPFINCTNCGPRYSIIENTPYDRPSTSMKDFEMCDFCAKEYQDPLNRRFHAQPVACAICGPKLSLLDKELHPIKKNPITETIRRLKEGKIVAIKGIGGFHLACDASNQKAIAELRKRKKRPDKPFAVMAKADDLAKIVEVSQQDWKVLKSPAAPIFILPQKKQNIIAKNVAPQNPNLGIFLPYAPLHHLLLKESPPFLIMTSGNQKNEPIATEPEQLQNIADFFLTNNRPILNRSDDSVLRPIQNSEIFLRRSRGYVPNPILIKKKLPMILGTGAELKLTFALSKNDRIYPSPYIGNQESKATEDFYREVLKKYQSWFKIKPEKIACDLHPNYFTTNFAKKSGLPFFQVQHHHAHIAAVMAENQLEKDVIGIVYDGTGFGNDGNIWGGEIFRANLKDFARLYHLNYMPLPGGDAAIKHPIRIAYAYLREIGENTELLTNISKEEKTIIDRLLKTNSYLHQTSSMGRLFDCAAAILGLFPKITFEAQSAMALEFLCAKENVLELPKYPYEISEKSINIRPLISKLAEDRSRKISPKIIASKFHHTVIEFTVQAALKIRKKYRLNDVVLAGGVMQNGIILHYLQQELRKKNFTVYTPKSLSPNDSSLAVGQIMVAAEQ